MGIEQVTNVAIQIQELSQKTDTTFWVALIGCAGSIFAAIISGFTSHRVKDIEKKQQTQWAYIQRRSLLVDQTIEVCVRMLYNKLLIANNLEVAEASKNLFVLQKEALVIESQFVVYGSSELVNGIHGFVGLILSTPNDQFLAKWGEIYDKGSEYLLICRKELGEGIGQKYKEFEKGIKDLSKFQPPTPDQVKMIQANTMGGIAKQ